MKRNITLSNMQTKFKIVETEDYILAVSDEEIEASELVLGLYPDFSQIRKSLPKSDNLKKIKDKSVFKIIAYKPKGDAKELDLPLLPEEECCEGDGSNCNGSCCIVEDNVEKLAESYVNSISYKVMKEAFVQGYLIAAFIKGYKSATKVYSEEDLRKAFEAGMYFVGEDKGSYEEFIQSLKQPKTPKWFVADREKLYHAKRKGTTEFQDTKGYYSWILKTTTINGKTYLVGTYE